MKSSEAVLALVGGAVLFSITKLFSVSTSFTPGQIPSTSNAPAELNFMNPPESVAAGNVPPANSVGEHELLCSHFT